MKDEILTLATQLFRENNGRWRWGQSVFNAAYQLYPDKADKLRGGSFDCYYINNNIDEFLDIMEN